MKERYVLWLDESGDFDNERMKKNFNKEGSLVGGYLLKEEDARRVEEALNSGKLLNPSEINHACENDIEKKAEYILPILGKMADEYNAIQVIFQNAEYIDGDERSSKSSSLDLYLRIISGGMIRLLRHLNAMLESVSLHVLIAHRMDKGTRGIELSDYENYLKNVIEEKRREGNIDLRRETEFSISIDYADNNRFLQLADFVCNTRLTRKAFEKVRADIKVISNEKSKTVKQFLQDLYNDENKVLFYSLEEQGEESIIERMLSGLNIADAVIEYFQTRKILSNPRRVFNSILAAIKNTNYRILKSQMKTLSRKITSVVESKDNYEDSERFLKEIDEKFIIKLKSIEVPYIHPAFNIQLMLADCYLREGDTPQARTSLTKCREILDSSDYSLEELFLFYQLKEKEALLAIDEFDYEKGIAVMEGTGSFMQDLMQAITKNDYLKDKFGSIRCEYYGDVLCMQLLAMMSLLRCKPELYDEMVRLSDIALKQYPPNPSELERHRQYRAYIEAEHGNCGEALRWLAASKCTELNKLDTDNIKYFLDEICRNEVNISCHWYLMYFLLILEKASEVDKELADNMFDALCRQKKLLEVAHIESLLPANSGQRGNTVSTDAISESKVPFIYHPLEIVYWKWGSYLVHHTEYGLAGRRYLELALEACFPEKQTQFRDKNGYLAMNIKGIAINAEYLAVFAENKSTMDKKYKILCHRIDKLLENSKTSEAAKSLIRKMQESVLDAVQDGVYLRDKLIEASKMIPF